VIATYVGDDLGDWGLEPPNYLSATSSAYMVRTMEIGRPLPCDFVVGRADLNRPPAPKASALPEGWEGSACAGSLLLRGFLGRSQTTNIVARPRASRQIRSPSSWNVSTPSLCLPEAEARWVCTPHLEGGAAVESDPLAPRSLSGSAHSLRNRPAIHSPRCDHATRPHSRALTQTL
jgi:hypothetical protein